MSEQAAPLFIESDGPSYAIVAPSIAAPPFPDIPTSLVFDIGDVLKRSAKKLPVERADLLKLTLFKVFSDSHARADVKLPEQAGRMLWASLSAEQCKEIHRTLTDQDIDSLRPFIAGGKPIEGFDADDIIAILHEAKECFKVASEKGYGIAFFAYE